MPTQRMPTLSRLLVRTLPWIPRPLIRRVAARYIAGEGLEELMSAAMAIHAAGLLTTVDVLGENVRTESAAQAATEEYFRLVDALHGAGLASEVSVKPTIVGLRLGEEYAARELGRIAERAQARGISLAIDMEDSTTTDVTLRLYRRLRERHPGVGVAIQAYLHRSVKDVESLLDLRPRIRVCKGIYIERPEVALQDRAAIRESYLRLVALVLDGGGFPAMATHDPWLVDRCLGTVRRRGLGRGSHEFQMLLGVGEGLRGAIQAAGSQLRLYCPYGRDWHAYSLRRLKENPKLAFYIARNLLSLRRRGRYGVAHRPVSDSGDPTAFRASS